MTVEEFATITTARIPTPAEFLSFVNGQGWKVVTSGTGAALRVADKTDPLARALAKMLSREPYRTNVLKLVTEGPPEQEVRPEEPLPPPAASDSPEDEWGNAVLRSGVAKPSRDADLVGSDRRTCAYRRVRLSASAAYPWEEWKAREYPPKFRVRHPEAVVPVDRQTFGELFPGVDQ